MRSATNSRAEPQNCHRGGKWGKNPQDLWQCCKLVLRESSQMPSGPSASLPPLKPRESEGEGPSVGENERIHPLVGTSHWDVSFPHQGGRALLQGCSSWPNTKKKPEECQPNTANMETDFPVPSLCASICPH